MKKLFICEKCNKEFINEGECLEHELNCKNETIFTCHKCGELTKWSNDNPSSLKANQCHNIDLGLIGYGSKLENYNIDINLCDNCIVQFIETLKIKDGVFTNNKYCYKEQSND